MPLNLPLVVHSILDEYALSPGGALAASGWAAEPNARTDVNRDGILFSESFEDANLVGRGWCDGTKFRITGDAMAGEDRIEYEWPDRHSGVRASY